MRRCRPRRSAAIRRVVGLQGGLHLRDECVRAGCLGAVAGRLHRGEHVVHAARHVEEGGAEIGLARRVVVDQHRDTALRRRRALQPQQRGGLAGHRVDLPGQRLQRAGRGIAGAHEHRIGHAGQFAGAVVGRDVGLRQAVPALRPLRGVHGERRQGLEHGHADALEFGLALVRTEDQRGVDDQVGHAPFVRARGMGHAKEQVLLLARAVEGIGAQAALFERADEPVEPAGVVAGHGGAVDGDGDRAGGAGQPVQRRDIGLDARPERVIEACERQRHGCRQSVQVVDLRQCLHRRAEIGRPAEPPVRAKPLRPGRIDAAFGRERCHAGSLPLGHEGELADQHMGRGAARDRLAEARRGRLRNADVRRIDHQQPRPVERGGQRFGRILRGRHHLQGQTGLVGRFLQPNDARRRHQRRAQDDDARRHLRLGLRGKSEPHEQEPEKEACHFPPCAGTASAGT